MRDIIDEVVVKNKERNLTVFNNAKDLPPYFGSVKCDEKKMKLTPIKGRQKLGKLTLITDIVESVKNFQLDKGEGKIVKVTDEKSTPSTTIVNVELIKLIKVCAAASYSPIEDYSIVLTEFVKELLGTAGSLNLPIHLPAGNKTQKLIGGELNTYLKELCDENSIPYHEEINVKAKSVPKRTKSKKSGMDKLLESANIARVE